MGIGVAAANGSLHLARAHRTRKIVLYESTNNDHEFYGLGTNTDIMRFQIPGSARFFRFYRADGATSSTEIFTILGTGSVGIGTPNPGNYKLAVAGKIASWEEVRVLNLNTPFPDYVFDKDYKLPTLAETENYIKQHKHLPEVPSAAEVEKEGMSLSDMNIITLKKVEELTLHLIELNKKVEELKKENADMKNMQEVDGNILSYLYKVSILKTSIKWMKLSIYA